MAGNPFKMWPSRRSDCVIVVELWETMGGKTTLMPQTVGDQGCCKKKKIRQKQPDIPGVKCSGSSVIKM